MKIAYFGTPGFSAILLEQLILDKSLSIEISLVVTQPDKPAGRKQEFAPSPVKIVAQKYHIPVWDRNIPQTKSEDMGDFSPLGKKGEPIGAKNDHIELLDKLKQVNLAIVFAFGFRQLIPLDLLKAPKIQFKIGEDKTSGFVNIHPSLLPRFRGSSPTAYPILLSENKTGVTLFVMDEKMDHGPIMAQAKMEIRLNDVRPIMEKKLTNQGFEMVKKLLNSLIRHPSTPLRVRSQVQNHLLATRAPFMTREDGFVPFSTLCKALKNDAITAQELPHIIRNYIEKYSHIMVAGNDFFCSLVAHSLSEARVRARISEPKKGVAETNSFNNSGLVIYNFWRGMTPWPGIWTKVMINNKEKRLKITKMTYVETRHGVSLQIQDVQLEGKNEVDFPTFQKAYNLFR